MQHKDEKSAKFYLFKIINLTKIVFLRLFFVDYPLLPADMINFLLYTVSAISFAPEKVVRTWGEPQKKLFSPIFGRYLKSAKNRGEPQKMTPSSETEFFLGVVRMGKL